MGAQANIVRAVLAATLFVAALAGAEAQRRQGSDEQDPRREEFRGERTGGERAGDRYARERGWELLGEKSVRFRVDRDVIDLSRGRGEEWFANRRYRTLHFVADGNDIHMIGLRLVYVNGFGEDFRIDRLIRQGEELPIDLRGDRSYIRRIEMTYRSRPDVDGEAVIKVYGEASTRGPSASADWEEVAREMFSREEDRVVLRIRRGEGRLGQIRLRAVDDRVHLQSISVRFRNGETQTIDADQTLEAGEHTRPIDLEGDQRRVEEVTVELRPGRRPGEAGLVLLGSERPGRPETR